MRKLINKYINSNSLPKILFIFSLCFLSCAYGYLTNAFEWFPHSLIIDAKYFVEELITKEELSARHVKTNYTEKVPVYIEESSYNGLSLVTGIKEDSKLFTRVIDMEGELIHEWEIDWFDLWPDATHIPKSDPNYPKSRPGTHIHGVLLLENGDLIFNFGSLGMVKLDVCGNVIWRLPYRTHHSIYLDEQDNLWVPGMIRHLEPLPDLPNYVPPFVEPLVLKVSLDGEVLKVISVFDIFMKNDLYGLLGLSSIRSNDVNVTGDTLHLNDLETFPSFLEEGVFKTGDIMLSFRNINTILVFREEDLKVTHISTGTFVRQHDPDFIDGNTISVFDNHDIGSKDYNRQSRILMYSFADGQHYEYYSGNKEQPFNTNIMGKNQWLPNGNLLITESKKGRAFEVTPQGDIVWEYVNIIDDGIAGITEEVSRLPDLFTEEFMGDLTTACSVE